MKFTSKALIVMIATGIIGNAYSGTLNLEEYLSEVENGHQSIRASKLSSESAELRKNEASLIFKPSIFIQGQSASDKKPTANKAFQGDRTDYSLLSTGLMEQFPTGLQAKLSYNLSHTKLNNATFLNPNDYRDGVASIELSQSLWRNFLGRESGAQKKLLEASTKANKHGEEFKIKVILSQAESIYWSLSQMQKIVRVQKESLERAQKIRNWTQNRYKTGLGESSDFLQSDANFKAREYELKSTMQELKNLTRNFNALRGIQSDSLADVLESAPSEKIKALVLPKKMELREDTLASLELQKIARANAELAIEKNKPTLELFGSYATNGRATNNSDAISNSTKTDHDTRAIGIRFSTSLDFGTSDDNKAGYQRDQLAADLNYQRKLFDQEKDWDDLVARFEDAKVKLSLVEKIEEAQKAKAANERDRLTKGRTVTFQVLNFEQDYAQSELARIQVESAILNLYSQLKIFSPGASK